MAGGMLGYIPIDAPSSVDALLSEVAEILKGEGWAIAGAVQANEARSDGGKSQMNLQILGTGEIVRISQDLGAFTTGCSLCPAGLADAVGRSGAALAGADLLIVNKFGKTEVDGGGFRPMIGQALADDIPVLTAVGQGNLPGFQAFAGGFAEQLPTDKDAALNWVRETARRA